MTPASFPLPDRDKLLIVVATGNDHKVSEFRAIIGSVLPEDRICVITQKQAAAICGRRYVSPEETGSTFAENARIKSTALRDFIRASEELTAYAAGFGAAAVIADDSGLCVDALGGRPGIYSARYAAAPGSFDDADDVDNVNKLLKDMEDVPDGRRGAGFSCHISAFLLFGPGLRSSIDVETRGELRGVVARKVMGEGGFGYDPVLFIPQLAKTTAMLTPEEKNSISHRGRALRAAAGEIYGHFTKLR